MTGENYMLCRNRVADFEKWKQFFDSHTTKHKGAGLRLMQMWRETGDPNNVFFLFKISSLERAQAFINHPDNPELGKTAGVLDGEIHYVEGFDYARNP